jgi:DNA adenine methylase
MRFSSKGKYNVPFGHKPDRFTKSYITKIVNQVEKVRTIMRDKDWEFRCSDWKETLAQAGCNDFAYLDPPYIGRHTDYFNKWRDEDSTELANRLNNLNCGFALSMWLENRYRKNDYIQKHFNNTEIKTFNHYYHVGASEDQRHEMIEALVIKRGHVRIPKDSLPVQKGLL